jgi:hypothetical protein
MPTRLALLFYGISFLICTAQADDSSELVLSPPSPEALTAAIQHCVDTVGSPFHLQVNCISQEGIRSLEIFPNSIAIWGGRIQISLPELSRVTLLKTLLILEFPKLEPSYGGRQRPENAEAGFRISCRIHLKIDEMEKSSVQQADGEQSPQLNHLAAELLNQVEPLADGGVSAIDLNDGLNKLAWGELAPQSFKLRFTDLSPENNTKPGSILRIAGGKISRQTYSPGSTLGAQLWTPLKQEAYQELISALQIADPVGFPVNLWSERMLELEIQVLQHKKTVLARSFSRLNANDEGPAQQRFDSLIQILRNLEFQK